MSQNMRPSGTNIVPPLISGTTQVRQQGMFSNAQPVYGYSTAPQTGYITAPVPFPGHFQAPIPVATQVTQGIVTSYPGTCAIPQDTSHIQMVQPGSHVLSQGKLHHHTDTAKLYEEQKRLEKERNFQLQQQRLKQFTVAGRKPSVNTDSFIESMLGSKSHGTKENRPHSQSPTKVSTLHVKDASAKSVTKELNPCYPQSKEQLSCNKTRKEENISEDNSQKSKNPKALENLIMKCSDFTGPQKAKTFQKPLVKDIKPLFQNTTTFATSQKARDWRFCKDLDQMFILPKPRFPTWCSQENVPPLYHQVENQVTSVDKHEPETNLLYPILLSSGLSRDTLGQIWDLCNQTTPGQLTQEEMYAVLALVALAQAGHTVNNTEILHSLPFIPIPTFNINEPSESSVQINPLFSADVADSQQLNLVAESGDSPWSSDLASTSAEFKNNLAKIPEPVDSNWEPFQRSSQDIDDNSNATDDDFDEFKSATPPAVRVAVSASVSSTSLSSRSKNTLSHSSQEEDNDDFADFQQALFPENVSGSTKTSVELKSGTKNTWPVLGNEDLMSPEEDKYSVFRTVHENQADEWGILGSDNSSVNREKDDQEEKDFWTEKDRNSQVSASVESSTFKNISEPLGASDDDDFGDFLDASTTTIVGPAEDSFTDFNSCRILEHSLESSSNFADFNKLQINEENNFEDFSNFQSVPCQTTSESCVNDVDEFGDFASSSSKLGGELTNFHLKDNISLAESQSVSSLELGTFDSAGQGADCKSLSRHGSVPSLDLKGISLEGTDNEEGFGEMQSAALTVRGRTSKSPSPSFDVTRPSEDDPSPNRTVSYQCTLSLPVTDRYSLIRNNGQNKEEDRHVTEWLRCLQSCHDLLQNATSIFNQMSCSSVCNEVLGTEEGSDYMKNLIEVYRVVCRISLASQSAGKQTVKLQQMLKDTEQVWNSLTVFFTGSPLMLQVASLDFTTGVLKSDPENTPQACGICLLSVDAKSSGFHQSKDSQKLTYGGRQYHTACANLWVNCVDPLLPALPLPQLL